MTVFHRDMQIPRQRSIIGEIRGVWIANEILVRSKLSYLFSIETKTKEYTEQ